MTATSQRVSVQSRSLLIIDDNPLVAEGIEHYLTGEDYTLAFATGAEEALQELSAHAFDAVIFDRGMTDTDVNALAFALKTQAPQTPIILISVPQGPSVDVTLFDAILPRPFTRTEFLLTIEEALPSIS